MQIGINRADGEGGCGSRQNGFNKIGNGFGNCGIGFCGNDHFALVDGNGVVAVAPQGGDGCLRGGAVGVADQNFLRAGGDAAVGGVIRFGAGGVPKQLGKLHGSGGFAVGCAGGINDGVILHQVADAANRGGRGLRSGGVGRLGPVGAGGEQEHQNPEQQQGGSE